jgi:hypothetical protein
MEGYAKLKITEDGLMITLLNYLMIKISFIVLDLKILPNLPIVVILIAKLFPVLVCAVKESHMILR